MSRLIFIALVLIMSNAATAGAQDYPVSGEVYLSFEANHRVTSRDVAPGEQFELWIIADIPNSSTQPGLGIVGIEGGIAIPPGVQFVEAVFLSPALNLGHSFRQPDLETFVVGLGECWGSGPAQSMGYLVLELVEDGNDIEIGVTAPAVQAAAVSSFAGLGPGWASQDCGDGGPIDLWLFAETPGGVSSVVLNSTAVPAEPRAFTHLKSRYR